MSTVLLTLWGSMVHGVQYMGYGAPVGHRVEGIKLYPLPPGTRTGAHHVGLRLHMLLPCLLLPAPCWAGTLAATLHAQQQQQQRQWRTEEDHNAVRHSRGSCASKLQGRVEDAPTWSCESTAG
jgi:hypothetical protein